MTLSFTVSGPFAAWSGTAAGSREIDCESGPSRSQAIGMVAAAIGIPRSRPHELYRLQEALLCAVVTRRSGVRLVDYQTSREYGNPSAEGIILRRDYACGGEWTVLLEGEEELLRDIEQALLFPVFPIYLGRKSCPPDAPPRTEIIGSGLADAVRAAVSDEGGGYEAVHSDIPIEGITNDYIISYDRLVSPAVRTFGPRRRHVAGHAAPAQVQDR